jgi:hypothetical protein
MLDNQLRKHMSTLTVVCSSDERVLLTRLFSADIIAVFTVVIFASRIPVHLLVMGRIIETINQ